MYLNCQNGNAYEGSGKWNNTEVVGENIGKFISKWENNSYDKMNKKDRKKYKQLPCAKVVVSKNLHDAMHIAPYGKSRTISFFVTKNLVKNWYLLFPGITCDGKNPVAIPIENGTMISFDGRFMHHCTCIGDNQNNPSAYPISFVANGVK